MASVLVSLLHSLRSLARSRASLHLEILALRHQLAVVTRTRRPRLRLTSTDRVLWAWRSRNWRGWRSVLHIVKPETVVAWHRRGFRLFWTWKSRRRTGRPGVPADVRALIRELSTANPLWGAPRIHGELQKLGLVVSQSTVAKYMRRHPRPPSQTWQTFHTNHASQIMAAALFVVPTVTFRLLFVLVVLAGLLHSLRFLVRSRVALHLEILALRHQLAVVNRTRRPRLQLTATDRVLWAWLSRTWRRWRSVLHIVKPDTVVGWHRRGCRLFWTWKSRRPTGRRGVPADVRALIRELSTANPL